jgi:transposase-like protein
MPELKPVPDPEVSDRPRRRKFTAKYKLAVLRELDTCTEPGQVGAVLRREGLYSSHVTSWRRAREAGELQGLASRTLGRPAQPLNRLQPENDRLRRENDRLREELRKASVIIDVQKKLSTILGISLSASGG